MKKLKSISGVKVLLISAIFAFAACEKKDLENPDENIVEGWKTELIDSIPGSNAGVYNMLTYDADSGIHVAYVVLVGDNNTFSLKYAYKPYNGSWTTTEVENVLSDDIIDIAVDNQKNIFIAYRGYLNGNDGNEIMYIAEKSINGAFRKVKVDVLGVKSFQARYPAIYADNNVIHMSFERANYGIRYTSYSYQGSFSPAETLDDNISPSNSDIVVDSEGNKHIIHVDNQNVYYSYCSHSENTWTVTHIATANDIIDSYAGIDIVTDKFDNLHVAYRFSASSNNVHYLSKPAESIIWQEQSIGNAGISNRLDKAIACDTLGNPHILYDENYGLKIASKNGSWSYEHILGNSDYRCDTNYDLEITDKNRAHVSFYCQTTGVLRYATRILK